MLCSRTIRSVYSMGSRGRKKNSNWQEQIDLFREHFDDIIQDGELVPSTSAIYSELGSRLSKNPKAVYLAVHSRNLSRK